MSRARMRTVLTALLVSAVAARVSAPRPVTGAFARVADDPVAALAHAFDGWSAEASLGAPSAHGVREVPLALGAWVLDVLGVPLGPARTTVLVGVLVLAVVGAVRLAWVGRDTDDESWSPWVAAAVYAAGPVMLAASVDSPLTGLAAAALPWLLEPVVRRPDGWRGAARSAVWLAPVGLAGTGWAVAAASAGVVAVVAVTAIDRTAVRWAARWAVLALLSSSWWVAVAVWESRHATDVSGLLVGSSAIEVVRAALGSPSWSPGWVLLAALAPLVVAIASLSLGLGESTRPLLAAMVGLSLLTLLGVATGWTPPVAAPGAGEPTPAPWAPGLGVLALTGLLAWAPFVERVLESVPDRGTWTARRSAPVVGAAVVVLATLVGPVLAAQEPPDQPEAAPSGVWDDVAAWSDEAPDGRVLVLPAVATGREDAVVTRALAGRPWVGRDALPTSGAPATAALDDLLWRLGRGQAGADTASALRRLGISYVLLRDDVDDVAERERPAALVRYALAAQGATRVAVLGAPEPAAQPPVDFGLRTTNDAVEVWALGESADGWVHAGAPLPVAGDAGAASDLAGAGLGPDPLVSLVEPDSGEAALVTDGARLRDVDQRVAIDPYGPTLTAEVPRTLVPGGAAPAPTAVRELTGVASVSASSSAADLDGSQRRVGSDATAAVDGNVFTSWRSRRGTLDGQWWEVRFDRPTDLSAATAQVVVNAFASYRVGGLRLVSDTGTTEVLVPGDGVVPLAAAGTTTRLRIQATSTDGVATDERTFAIAEVNVPGITVQQGLTVSGSTAGSWLLSSRPGSYANCVPSRPLGQVDDAAAGATVCDRGLGVEGLDVGSLRRQLPVATATSVAGRVWVRAADSEASDRLADRLGSPNLRAEGSSVAAQDLVTRAQAAADADPTTAWRPAPEDQQPVLSLSWSRPSTVAGLRLVPAEGTGVVASAPTEVEVVLTDDGVETGRLTTTVAEDGGVRLERDVVANGLTVTVLADSGLTSVDSLTGGVREVPVAVAEVELDGGPSARFDHDTVERLPCGSGPVVTVAGDRLDTAVLASARGVVEADTLTASLCSRPVLPAGDVEVGVEASFSWLPLGLALSPTAGPLGAVDSLVPMAPTATPLPTGLVDGSGGRVTTGTTDGGRTLSLAVPADAGWRAVAAGRDLDAVTVGGWMQAWTLPDGVDEVRLVYSAGPELRLLVAAASAGWLLVALLSVPWRRRRAGRPTARRDQAMAGRSTQA